MSALPDWTIWLLAAAVVALFGWYFWHVGSGIFRYFAALVGTIQNWPQIRRAMVDAEARSPRGRYPLWFRAVRVALILLMVGLVAYLIWRRLVS